MSKIGKKIISDSCLALGVTNTKIEELPRNVNYLPKSLEIIYKDKSKQD